MVQSTIRIKIFPNNTKRCQVLKYCFIKVLKYCFIKVSTYIILVPHIDDQCGQWLQKKLQKLNLIVSLSSEMPHARSRNLVEKFFGSM